MINIECLTFNPFQENTYVVYDETQECIIIDSGCFEQSEKDTLSQFISQNNLKVVDIVNTHGHIDHIVGLKYVCGKYKLSYALHKEDMPFIERAADSARMYGFTIEEPPKPGRFVTDKDRVSFGNSSMEILFTPGHSPGGICLYNKENNILMAGDVLFQNSIGRTDLPLGDFNTLISSIKSKLFVLPEETKVYPGHGPKTTIGYEKKFNPFLQ